MAVVDGFTITAGNPDGSRLNAHYRGRRMYISHADPNIIACTFSKNSALYTGGVRGHALMGDLHAPLAAYPDKCLDTAINLNLGQSHLGPFC
jgi:hypothetical protein